MPTVELERVGAAGFDLVAQALVSDLARHIERELLFMKMTLGSDANEEDFDAIREQIAPCLTRLQELLEEGRIRPLQRVRLSPDEPEPAQPSDGERPLRLGFFPTAANPLHWMHLLGGLLAISRFQLDKVVYVIAGSDSRKRDLLPAAIRHRIGRRVLEEFSPFLGYSPICLDSPLSGEINVFRLLQLNAHRHIEAFYLAGTDHSYRADQTTGETDTLQRLEDGVRRRLHGFDERMHSLSVIFLDRGDPPHLVDTFLQVYRIDRLPMHVSSTLIREALRGRWPPQALAGLPFTVFAAIRALDPYGAPRLPGGEETAPARAPARVNRLSIEQSLEQSKEEIHGIVC
jgi:nicotinic acid mononucleotide adenylyltransferase